MHLSSGSMSPRLRRCSPLSTPTANPAAEPSPRPSPVASDGLETTAGSEPIARGAGELGVSGVGLAIGAGVVALIWFIHAEGELSVLCTKTVWFVIPIGAFCCGMAAGLGFFLGIRLFNQRPSRARRIVLGGPQRAHAGYRSDFWTDLVVHGIRWRMKAQGHGRGFRPFPQFLQAKPSVENQRVRSPPGMAA